MKISSKKGLKGKLIKMNLVTIISILIIFTVITICSLISQIHNTAIENLIERSYDSQIFAMRNLTLTSNDDKLVYLERVAPYFVKYMSDDGSLRVQIISSNMELIGDSQHDSEFIFTGDIKRSIEATKSYSFFNEGNEVFLSLSSPILLSDESIIGVIRYTYSLKKDYRNVFNIVLIQLLLIILASSLSYITTRIISNRIIEPITKLRLALNNMKAGEFGKTIHMASNDEIEELGEAFNLMSGNLKNYILKLNDEKEKQRIFFSNITHQLKTPLTSIIGYAELIQRMSETDEVCENAFIIEEAGESLLNTIENLLEVSKVSKSNYEPIFNKVNLKNIIDDCLLLLAPRFNKWGIQVINETFSLEIVTDKRLLKEVILTLLDNCLLHSKCSKIKVSVDVIHKTNELTISIYDDGIGIKAEDLEAVFDPFYRSNNTFSKGSGLGLSMSRTIVELLDGKIFVNKDIEFGTEVIIFFNYCTNETIKK